MTNNPTTTADPALEGLGKTPGALADVAYGVFFALGWLGIFFFVFMPRGF